MCITKWGHMTTPRLTLKIIEYKDAPKLYEIYSNKDVCKYFDIVPYIHVKQAKDQIKLWLENSNKKTQIRYGIYLNDLLIGTCGIYSIYWHQSRASIGFDLDPDYWEKGFMTEAITSFLEILKTEFKLNRIQATVLEENKGSIQVLNKTGFKYEGTLVDYEKWKGQFVDLQIYSIIL